MEFEFMMGDIEWEARRVAAAFDVGELLGVVTEEGMEFEESGKNWGMSFFLARDWFSVKQYEPEHVQLEAPHQVRNIIYIRADQPQEGWINIEDVSFWDFVTRGLYRLGFQNEALISQLPVLSEHEKLELRLTMPREFWPQKWLGEEGAGDK